ncbi:histone-like nucleoid-structuring protein Lsr2 [Solicola gregarius]|uniref:Lsr2 family protein n=1 Tax=Solicola gregarius TaxID=2908642 RepID=A0AA46TL87_9ACTN|nr:Lsr2 family protein [Solicola gregarius]UYM06977.1 Lsr2 family protein [Solicola gregarius]
MAQKVQILLVDDIDGGEADETVRFGLDGVDYEIDLSTKNAGKLRDALAKYVGESRRVGGRRRIGRKGASGGSASDAATIREWAKDNGWEVSDRGRVSAEIREAYAAAH